VLCSAGAGRRAVPCAAGPRQHLPRELEDAGWRRRPAGDEACGGRRATGRPDGGCARLGRTDGSARVTNSRWGVGAGRGRRDEDGGSGGRGGTRWWLGGRVEVELGRVRVSLGMGFWTVLPCWDECTFCSVLCSVNRELTGNFGSRGTGTEQEPIFSVPVLSVPVPGSFGSVLVFSCLGLAVVARARSTGTSPGKKKKKNRGLSYLESGLECLISSRQTIQDKW
jgi:hypothetical protein